MSLRLAQDHPVIVGLALIGLGLTFGLAIPWWKPPAGTPCPPTKVDAIAKEAGITDQFMGRELPRVIVELMNEQTRSVKVLTISGRDTSRELDRSHKKFLNTEVRWLQLDPTSKHIQERAKQVPSAAQPATSGQIREATEVLRRLKSSGSLSNLSLHYYDEMPVFRFVIIDDTALVSYYPLGASEDDYPVYVIRRGQHSLFGAFENYFDRVWKNSKEAF